MKIALNLLLLLVIAAIYALIGMWLWNVVMPDLFGLPQLSFWNAFGIKVLTDIFTAKTNWND